MPNDNAAEERRKKNQRERRRDSRPSAETSEPIAPPLAIQGPEQVRDSHC